MKYLKISLALLWVLLCLLTVSCADECADGHSVEKWDVVRKATCAVDGSQEGECTRCGETVTQTLPATGEHRPGGYYVTKASTMFEKGERAVDCQRCKQVIGHREIPAIADSLTVERAQTALVPDLSACVVLYDISVTSPSYIASVTAVRDALSHFMGYEVELCTFQDRGKTNASCEILIGTDGTSELLQARTHLSGDGFVVLTDKKTIAIVGSDELYTMRAAQYFAEICIPKTDDASPILFSTLIKSQTVNTTVLGTTGSFAFDLVFSRELDNNPAHKHVSGSESDSRDYPCVAAEQLAKDIAELMEASAGDIAVRGDQVFTAYELLIGTFPEREEVEIFRSSLQGHEYGILVHDGQVILTAHNDIALQACIAHFLELLELSAREVSGKTVFALPDGFCVRVGVENGWVTEFVRPEGEGIKLYNTQYNNDGSLQYYYVGEGATPLAYEAYCAQLLDAGYRLLWSNAIENSLFRGFVHDTLGITLYVAYDDFKHEADFAVEDAYYWDFEKCIRVISAPLDRVTLPDEELLAPDPVYDKVADTAITQLPFTSKAIGMGYIIRLEDGRFIVIDGGGVNTDGAEHDQIWNVLNELYKDAFGKAPTAAAPIVIAAWINTHSHWDHYYAFQQMLRKYGKTGLLRMEYMFGNFPDKMSIFAVQASSLQMGKETTIPAMQANVIGGFQYIKVHTGQKFHIANATLEILMTYEDHNPRRICNSNDTCTIVRFEIANQDAPEAAPTTALFLADAFRFQSRYLCAMYGDYLQSDIVQLAHHGNIGCEKAVYVEIAAKIVLFPNAYTTFSKYVAGSSSTWNYEVDHYVVKEQESVKYVFVAEKKCLTFLLLPTGPDCEGIFDIANDKAAIEFDGKTAIKKK